MCLWILSPHITKRIGYQIASPQSATFTVGPQIADFSKNLRTSLFNDDLSNEPNFGRFHLAGENLQTLFLLISWKMNADRLKAYNLES